MNRMFEIANRLMQLRNDRAQAKNNLVMNEVVLADIERALIPADGWPGKNETERKVAMQTAYNSASGWTLTQSAIKQCSASVTLLDAEIEGLRDEQNAYEWSIRDQTNVLMGGVSIFDALLQYGQDRSLPVGADYDDEFPDHPLEAPETAQDTPFEPGAPTMPCEGETSFDGPLWPASDVPGVAAVTTIAPPEDDLPF